MPKERDFQREFSQWLRSVHRQTGAFELKLSRTSSLPYSALAEHQEQALLNAKHGTLVYKIPDAGYQNPFDCVCLSGIPSFVVVRFPSKKTYLIDIDDWARNRDRSKRKSLTEDEAEVIHSFKF